MSSYYGSKIHILSSTQKTNSKLIFRCIAAIPPIFASSLVSDLGAYCLCLFIYDGIYAYVILLFMYYAYININLCKLIINL